MYYDILLRNFLIRKLVINSLVVKCNSIVGMSRCFCFYILYILLYSEKLVMCIDIKLYFKIFMFYGWWINVWVGYN